MSSVVTDVCEVDVDAQCMGFPISDKLLAAGNMCVAQVKYELGSLSSLSSSKQSQKALESGLDMEDFIIEVKNRLHQNELELSCVILWQNWYSRNLSVHSNQGSFVEDVVVWLHTYLDDFKSTNVVEDQMKARGPVTEAVWCPPIEGQLKINTDATVDVEGKKIGIGVVIREHTGFVMASCAQKIDVGYSPVLVEAEAILRGLQFTKDSGLCHVVVESDAAIVVAYINDPNRSVPMWV
ncbi:hypothetical protein Dsin_021439 [Dipteronia sinensis]|uniref:RNase H type-1 domain-containing protein n=1 Tax=Dipteronia sinensis TaxID=43782 RepID=A0AAE0DZ40_9ROSI|nr:hypothetical protein Dsin_021439 [Dipteronia sinensis]